MIRMSSNRPIMTLIDCIDHFVVTFIHELPIMLALCFILSTTYYAKNYAGIIGLGLAILIYNFIMLTRC